VPDFLLLDLLQKATGAILRVISVGTIILELLEGKWKYLQLRMLLREST